MTLALLSIHGGVVLVFEVVMVLVMAGLSLVGLSFANVTSRTKPVEGPDISTKPVEGPDISKKEAGKKGKRPMRVLLSTAGGRRY